MSKMKKTLISVIIAIAAIVGISTTANGYAVDQEINITYNEYLNDGNIFCVQHGQRLSSSQPYKIISQVRIEGKNSTDYKGKTITNDANAKFAAILNGKNVNEVRNSVWNYVYTWLNVVGKNHEGLSLGFANNIKGAVTDLDTSATEYVNELGNMSITDNTNKDNIKTTVTTLNGREYTKVGPLNWTFSGTLKEITAYDQNNNAIGNAIYSVYVGNTETVVTADQIKSESNFYVAIPADSSATKITRVSAKADVETKAVNIWFLKSKWAAYQNLIIREPETATQEISTDFDYNITVKIKLSGYVWVDKIYGKTSTKNDLYKEPESNGELFDTNDILLDGITVRLKDNSGATVKEAITSDGGKYSFEDILAGNLSKYYIEFEYDGLTYTNVIARIDKDNGSKAAENATARQNFNNNFSIVEGESESTGYTRNTSSTRVHDLSYNVDRTEHISTLINNGQYTIQANTNETGYKIIDNFKQGQDEITNINLGLTQREQPNISLKQDIDNAKVSVNGYSHIYQYGQRFNHPEAYGGDGFNVGVKFSREYNQSYYRAVYEADYTYTEEDEARKDRELKIVLTYQIRLLNTSTTLTTQVNNIVDYFDNNYTLIGAGTGIDEQSNLTGNLQTTAKEAYNDNYSRTMIATNLRIEPQRQQTLYIQFELNREAVINILNANENLENVAEVNSYSVFDNQGRVYAGIDTNSNPANCNPSDISTYQDDTDASPSLVLELADARELAGMVFLDSTSGELQTGSIRQGSGAYEDGETRISGVEVTVTENTGTGKVYTATTDGNGEFYISGYIPGDYTITYTWGDTTYTVQDYKGTVYDSSRDQTNKSWYKENVDTRLTDALDDYTIRNSIDEEIKHITNSTTTTIEKMNSTTPTMGIGVEYETTTTASSGDKYTYLIRNIDLGIVERARQDLGLTKRISTMKVTLANGQVVSEIQIDEDGRITGQNSGITYMGPSTTTNPANGFLRLELDNELIQGAKIEVGYEIKATNNSELDYLSENYYHYGIVEGNVVTINPTAIIDYLDSNWAVDLENNQGWEIKTVEEIEEIVAEVVYNNEETAIENKTILYTENLKDRAIEPTQSETTTLNVSKTLTTTDEIWLDNETELVEVTKTGGSTLVSTPGDYIPGTGSTQSDDSMAETTIVTPSTGEDRNVIIYIVTGITTLAILAAGVVLIKKKAIK